jgi:hypothetical protein
VDLGGAELVTDGLQSGRVVAAGEAVGQRGPAGPGLAGLPFRPLMAVQPYLDRVGEVAADLDERRPEVVVPNVEVVAGDPTVGSVPAEMRRATIPGLTGSAGRDPLELLRPPIAATPDLAVFSCRARKGFIFSIFRSPLAKLIIGIWLLSANERTARRNWSPIRPTTTGDGIGNPRNAKNCTT